MLLYSVQKKTGKGIAGTIKGVNKHKGSYMNPPLSLKLCLKRTAHFRLISQEAEALFYIII
ncbi:hypothetical protein EO92_09000 [Methanosarcina sp. 2.H.A.1B.4]|nr:hypothetical protein EO92_09000 [Methanosarcina sp. 2.H.A.1B.4]